MCVGNIFSSMHGNVWALISIPGAVPGWALALYIN